MNVPDNSNTVYDEACNGNKPQMTREDCNSNKNYEYERRNDDNDDSINSSPVTSIQFLMLLLTLYITSN